MPALAESCDVSDDGLTYTFKLRKGVKFHTTEDFTPTRDFNADDVVFSFERQRDAEPSLPQGLAAARTSTSTSMDMGNLLKSVEKVDDHTVKFTLTHRRRRSSPTWPWISPRSCRPNTPTR